MAIAWRRLFRYVIAARMIGMPGVRASVGQRLFAEPVFNYQQEL